MTGDSQNPSPAPSPAPIEYANTGLVENSRRTVRRRTAVAFVSYVLLSAACLYITSLTTNAFWSLSIWGYFTLAVLGLTLWLRLARGKRGYGRGVLTALLCALLIGVGLLILLICTCSGTFR